MDVSTLPPADTYLTPGSAMETYLEATHRAVASGATGLCVVGELPGDALAFPHTWPGWSRYEAAVNHVFTAVPFNALCTYDTRTTDPSLLQVVRETHPQVRSGASRAVNADYRAPLELLIDWSDASALPVELSTPLLEITDLREPGDVQLAATKLGEILALLDTALQLDAEHLPPADPTLVDVDEYILALDEVLNNALNHGAPPVALRLWVDHDHVVTTVNDRGRGFEDPFMGYTIGVGLDRAISLRPRMGLWLARQLCDDLTYRHDGEGFTVRLRADLDVRYA